MSDSECTCDEEWGLHSCPYACEIGGDCGEDYCNCCDYCEDNCAQEI